MAKRDVREMPGTADKCNPNCAASPGESGPPREAGGTTGSGNLSPGQTSRTGGTTTGVPAKAEDRARDRGVPPDAR